MKKFIFIIVFFVLTFNIYSQNRDIIKLDSNHTIYTNPLKILVGKIYLGTEFRFNNKLNLALSIAYKHKFISEYADYPFWYAPSLNDFPYLMYYGIILEPALYQKYRLNTNKKFFFGFKSKFKYYWYNNGVFTGNAIYYPTVYSLNQKVYKIDFEFIARNKMIFNKIYLEWYVGIGILGTYKITNITKIDRQYTPYESYDTDTFNFSKHLIPSVEFGLDVGFQLKKRH